MAVLPIRLFPDPILRTRSKPVVQGDLPATSFLKDLVDTLYAQPSGIGIAAPQVGEARRIVVVDVSARDPAKRREILINPFVRRTEGEVLSREGCMSLPDYTGNVKRAARVWIEWRDEKGRLRSRLAGGIEAICLQHEIDHLNGVLFIDRISSLKTDIFPRKRRR
jgi:peptide deformylase